jgi:integrase
VGRRRRSIDKAWAIVVLKANGHKPVWVRAKTKSRSAKLAPESRALLDAIDLHFHDLRREAGSRWMDAGVPLTMIQKWLGHANISQTSTYLAASGGGDAEAMRAFEERAGRLPQVAASAGSDGPEPIRSDNGATEKTQENATVH